MTPIDDTVTHGCDAAEFEGRLLRAQCLMTEHELDGLLLTTGPNFRYFTGFDTEFWESPTRPWFLIAPREGAPTAVVPEVGEGAFGRTWVADIRTWPAPRPADDGVSLLSGVLATVPRRFGRIGAELGRESVVRMPLTDFLRIRDGLPGTEIVDGSPCIWSIRMVKTEAEIARAGHICRIVSDAFAAFPGKLTIGMTEREACRALRTDIIARGADNVPYMPAVAGPAGYSQIIGGASDRVIERGDILIIDTGARFDGYFSDFDRNFAFGPVDDAARKAHEAVWDATEAGIARGGSRRHHDRSVARHDGYPPAGRCVPQHRRPDGPRARPAIDRTAVQHARRRNPDRSANGADHRARHGDRAGPDDRPRGEHRDPRRRRAFAVRARAARDARDRGLTFAKAWRAVREAGPVDSAARRCIRAIVRHKMEIRAMDHAARAHHHDHWIDYPGYPLERDFPEEEYDLRVGRARRLMAEADLDALVITTSAVGHWFTSLLEPHEWHDRCTSRSAWYTARPERDRRIK